MKYKSRQKVAGPHQMLLKAYHLDQLPQQYFKGKKQCPHDKQCGGCQLQQLNYEGQLFVKNRYLKQLFQRYVTPKPIIGMTQPYYYRNKVHAVFKKDRHNHLISGMYAEGSHHVIQIEHCLLEDQRAQQIIRTLHELIVSFKLTIYDEDLRQGLIRHVLIRTGHQSGEILVVLVTASKVFPSKKNFVKALLKKHPEITTVVQNINTQTDNMVLGRKEEVLYGKGYIIDQLCDMSFKISPQSFYQINPMQTEKLYQTAIQLAGLTGEETVLDTYCGIGTIGLIASQHAHQVIGVELNPAAIQDAKLNKALNHVENIDFYQDDAEHFMLTQAQEQQNKIQVVIMDPPRAGSTPAFLDALITLNPQKIIYISCNPQTLKRDLDYLVSHSPYKPISIIPYDLFPNTSHVETVCLLSKKP